MLRLPYPVPGFEKAPCISMKVATYHFVTMRGPSCEKVIRGTLPPGSGGTIWMIGSVHPIRRFFVRPVDQGSFEDGEIAEPAVGRIGGFAEPHEGRCNQHYRDDQEAENEYGEGTHLPDWPRLSKSSAPKERIDGTHNPTKSPSSLWPLNQRPTDNRNEIPAAAIKSSFDLFIAVILELLSRSRMLGTVAAGPEHLTETKPGSGTPDLASVSFN